MMSRKERTRSVIHHIQPDMVPWQIGFTQPAHKKLADRWGEAGLEARIGNHILMLNPGLPGRWDPARSDHWIDEFGVSWNRTVDKDIGNPEDFVLQSTPIDKYRWPDPHDPRRYEGFPAAIKASPDCLAMCPIHFSLFERAWTMRGMERLFMDMMDDTRYVEALLERILEFNLSIIDHACSFDIDAVYSGDDWGQQHGLLMGPEMWRRIIKPVLKRMYARTRSHGKFVFIHSCGDVREIIPDLIEIGVNVLNPFQPEVMDVRQMKREYGKDLCFWGGVSTQRTLPYGSPDDVRKEVRGLMRDIGAGGGYIVSPAHDIPGDVPVENIIALIETIQSQR